MFVEISSDIFFEFFSTTIPIKIIIYFKVLYFLRTHPWVLHLYPTCSSLPSNSSCPLSTVHMHVCRVDHPWLDNLCGCLSLEDTASSSLNRHRTPGSSSVGVTTWNFTCSHWYASLLCHYAGLVQAVILLRVHGCISPVMSRHFECLVSIFALRCPVHDFAQALGIGVVLQMHQLELRTE